jgi:hypothetical protein
MITYTEQEVKPHLQKDGILYLLFDVVSMSDLGESKNFTVPLSERKKILFDYKAGRTYSPLYLDAIELYRKYYIHRGDKVQLVYSDEYEADDYVEPLLDQFTKEWANETKTKSVALVSSDFDWASYIVKTPQRQIDLINEGFHNPFSTKQFVEMFQFYPTIASNVLYKALFGDKSDNIVGAAFIKKAKFNVNIKMLCRDYIQYVSQNNLSIDDVLHQFKSASFMTSNNKPNKDSFDLLYLSLSVVDLKVPILEKLYTNIRVIRSSLKDRDISDYVHWNKEQQKTNDVIHQGIFGVKFLTTFGKI